jgi:hypothetical protein
VQVTAHAGEIPCPDQDVNRLGTSYNSIGGVPIRVQITEQKELHLIDILYRAVSLAQAHKPG